MKPIELIKTKNEITLEKTGVYMLYNIISGKAYIGQASQPLRRRREHFYKFAKGKHENIHMQNSYNKYGEQAFKFILLENCERDRLDEIEGRYVSLIDEELRYNQKAVRGVAMSEETRKKLSIALKGRPKNYSGMRGKKHSEETKKRMSESAKKLTRSKEHQENLTESIRKSKEGKEPWNKGMKMSSDHCKKLSIAHLKEVKNDN